MRALDVIAAKRDGRPLTREEITFFVQGVVSGEIPDYQAAAWLMAAYLRGLDARECAALTTAMLDSGRILPRMGPPGPRAGKHSTGGVGDKTSLIVAPLAASMGMIVPKLSGRGLGHTGGTLDKLASIPGLTTDLDQAAMARALSEAGFFIAGQTPDIAPADKVLYALRDATATVDEPGLIAASIMSKKLAEGLDALVLDVKSGCGAFCRETDAALALARRMVDAGRAGGVRTAALVTAMDQPLGRCAGNALEVAEAVEVLSGRDDPACRDLKEVCLGLAGWMAHLSDKAETPAQGAQAAREHLEDGRALNHLARMIRAQGGDPEVAADPSRLPRASREHVLTAPGPGYVAKVDAMDIGQGLLLLGAGRRHKEDAVDHGVGLVLEAKAGREVAQGDALARIYFNNRAMLDTALPLFESAFRLAQEPPENAPCLLAEVLPDGSMRSPAVCLGSWATDI